MILELLTIAVLLSASGSALKQYKPTLNTLETIQRNNAYNDKEIKIYEPYEEYKGYGNHFYKEENGTLHYVMYFFIGWEGYIKESNGDNYERIENLSIRIYTENYGDEYYQLTPLNLNWEEKGYYYVDFNDNTILDYATWQLDTSNWSLCFYYRNDDMQVKQWYENQFYKFNFIESQDYINNLEYIDKLQYSKYADVGNGIIETIEIGNTFNWLTFVSNSIEEYGLFALVSTIPSRATGTAGVGFSLMVYGIEFITNGITYNSIELQYTCMKGNKWRRNSKEAVIDFSSDPNVANNYYYLNWVVFGYRQWENKNNSTSKSNYDYYDYAYNFKYEQTDTNVILVPGYNVNNVNYKTLNITKYEPNYKPNTDLYKEASTLDILNMERNIYQYTINGNGNYWDILTSSFSVWANLFNYSVVGNITIGILITIPLMLSILLFIIKLLGR